MFWLCCYDFVWVDFCLGIYTLDGFCGLDVCVVYDCALFAFVARLLVILFWLLVFVAFDFSMEGS